MKNYQQRLIILFIVGMIVFVFWTLVINRSGPSSSLAYPPPPTQPGESGGYPGPQTNTPTPTATATESEPFSGPTPTQTPWPNPTSHSFPTLDTFRQGVAAAMGNASLPDRHNFGTWGFYWNIVVPNPYPTTVEHVPMLAWDNWTVWQPSIQQIQTMATRTPHNYWLVFNECENNHQCDIPPEVAADFYYEEIVQTMFSPPIGTLGADPDAQLIIGGINASPCGILWLTQFVQHYRANHGNDLYNAGWHFHIYPEVVPETWPDPDDPIGENGCNTWDAPPPGNGWWGRPKRLSFENWLNDAIGMRTFVYMYGGPDDEIWITEMGCLIADCAQVGFMDGYVGTLTSWLNNEGRWVDRYAWYTDWDEGSWYYTKLYANTTPVPENRAALGNYYAQIEPAAHEPLPWPPTFIYFPVVKVDQ